MRLNVIFLLVVFAAADVSAATKHYSFSNGYPTTTTRQTTGATVGAETQSAKKTSTSRTKKAVEKELVGKVVGVDSGDLIWVTPSGGKKTKVRLQRIDAPEQGQNYGVEAKKFLFDLVNAKEVTVRYRTKDRGGAISGIVYVQHEKGVVDVNLTMVQNGCAWYVEEKSSGKDSSEFKLDRLYAAGQESAKGVKRGLWSAINPIPPSEWRETHK